MCPNTVVIHEEKAGQDAGEWRLSRLLVEYAKVLDVLKFFVPEASNIWHFQKH